jgi:hypothetical protein
MITHRSVYPCYMPEVDAPMLLDGTGMPKKVWTIRTEEKGSSHRTAMSTHSIDDSCCRLAVEVTKQEMSSRLKSFFSFSLADYALPFLD